MTGRGAVVATIAALAVVGATVALALADLEGAPPPVSLAVPLLAASGLLCLAALGVRHAASVAWLGATGAAAGATVAITEIGLAVRDATGTLAALPVATVLCGAILVALGAAAGYAAGARRRLGRWVVPAAALAWSWLLLACAVRLAANASGLGTAGIPQVPLVVSATTWWAPLTLGFVALGVAGDLVAADRRARRRAGPPASERASDRASAGGTRSRAGALADELAGRSAATDHARTAATEAERARLAADLHADVLPAVRRALAEADRGGSPERLATDLRAVGDEIETLLARRRSIVVDELGLVAGLEWLAERLEERGDRPIVLAVAGSSGPGGRAPLDVERAAFRVAWLAIDNAARHAPGSDVHVSIAASPTGVELVVADEGPGIEAGAADRALRDGHRGLADMRAEAEAVGGRVDLGPAMSGTVVAFRWNAAG